MRSTQQQGRSLCLLLRSGKRKCAIGVVHCALWTHTHTHTHTLKHNAALYGMGINNKSETSSPAQPWSRQGWSTFLPHSCVLCFHTRPVAQSHWNIISVNVSMRAGASPPVKVCHHSPVSTGCARRQTPLSLLRILLKAKRTALLCFVRIRKGFSIYCHFLLLLSGTQMSPINNR